KRRNRYRRVSERLNLLLSVQVLAKCTNIFSAPKKEARINIPQWICVQCRTGLLPDSFMVHRGLRRSIVLAVCSNNTRYLLTLTVSRQWALVSPIFLPPSKTTTKIPEVHISIRSPMLTLFAGLVWLLHWKM